MLYTCYQLYYCYVSASEHIAGKSYHKPEENNQYILMSKEQFEEIFKKCTIQSLERIEEKHKQTEHFSRFGKDILACVTICKCSENVNKIVACLNDNFYILFRAPILTPYDREMFFSRVHDLKLKADIQQNVLKLLGFDPSIRINTMFYQSLLREVVELLLAHMIVINEKEFGSGHSKHSSTEQQILYYIAGFIVKKVKGNLDKLKCLRGLESILSFITTTSEGNLGFLENVKSWTKALDRGGLQYPSMNFYLLVREMDSIVSAKLYEETLSANSLMKSRTKDEIFDSFIVNYYWGNILKQSGYSDSDGKLFLEYIIDVFLNVKGFAIARSVRMAQEALKHKSSSSFRKSLQK